MLSFWLPLLFSTEQDEMITRILLVFLLMWQGLWKAIGMCLGRGPLAGDWSFAQFMFLYLAPVYPSRRHDSGGKAGRLQDSEHAHTLLRRFLINMGVLCLGAYALATYELHRHVRNYIYSFALMSFVCLIMEGPGALITSALDVPVVPPFDKPWLAQTVGEFWAQRWNNTTSLLLRTLCYDPILEGRLVKAPSAPKLAPAAAATGGSASETSEAAAAEGRPRAPLSLKLLGMTVTFVASALMHELILYYVNPAHWLGPLFIFFSIQAPLSAAEMLVYKRLNAAGIKLPSLMRIAITQIVLLYLGDKFFFVVMDQHGSTLAPRLAAAITAHFQGGGAVVLQAAHNAWQRLASA